MSFRKPHSAESGLCSWDGGGGVSTTFRVGRTSLSSIPIRRKLIVPFDECGRTGFDYTHAVKRKAVYRFFYENDIDQSENLGMRL